MKSTKILLIDDDKAPMRYYVKALEEANFDVEQKRDPDMALRYLAEEGAHLSLIILDSMMPPGEIFEDQDTNDGINTGRLLFLEIRKQFPRIPILVLTNLSSLDWVPDVSLDKFVRQARKIDIDPFSLAEMVQEMAESNP